MATCVPWGLDTTCCDEWDTLDPTLQERAEELAWNTLRTLSGGRVGACPVSVRPCVSEPCDICSTWWSGWYRSWQRWGIGVDLVGGQWSNCVCGTTRCHCEPLCEIVLPGPVAAVLAVDVGGVELPADAVRVDNDNRLVRTDGACWPSCQSMDVPAGAPGTLTIDYVPGIVPDSSALWAAGVLACEFTKACTGGKCRLPSSVTQVVRQGVSFTIDNGMFPSGKTGIREVDAFLVSINPNGHLIPPMVWSPDVPWAKHRYPTTTAVVTP